MEKFIIQGGVPLSGEIVPAGNKNAALPILAAYALSKHKGRPLKRLYKERERLLDGLRAAHKDARSEVGPRGARS